MPVVTWLTFATVPVSVLLPASCRVLQRSVRELPAPADVIQKAQMLVGVIYKTLHVQGSRNKLVHVCNKGGVTEGKGKRLISVRAPTTKKGGLFASNAAPCSRRCVQETCASQMFQNSQVVTHARTYTRTHTFCVDRQIFARVHFRIM